MVYQPHLRGAASAILTSLAKYLFTSICSHTGSAFLSVFEEGNKESTDRLSIASSRWHVSWQVLWQHPLKVGLQSISPFIESINHLLNSHLASSLLLHTATSPSIHGQLWDKGSRRDVYFFNVLRQRFWVRKSRYNRFSVFEVGLLPRHCSFSTSCNRRMSIWLQGTSLIWSLIRKHTRQVFSYLVC